jgi:hypothetical protein
MGGRLLPDWGGRDTGLLKMLEEGATAVVLVAVEAGVA